MNYYYIPGHCEKLKYSIEGKSDKKKFAFRRVGKEIYSTG